jgi:hypothetical protein
MLTTLTDAENDARPRPHFPLSGRVCRKKRSLGILIRPLSYTKQRKSSPGSQAPLKPISGASLLGRPAEIRLLASIGNYVPARGGLNPPVSLVS